MLSRSPIGSRDAYMQSNVCMTVMCLADTWWRRRFTCIVALLLEDERQGVPAKDQPAYMVIEGHHAAVIVLDVRHKGICTVAVPYSTAQQRQDHY